MWRFANWLSSCCCGLLFVGAAFGNPLLFYFDEPRELQTWAGRVAVFADGQPRGAVEAMVNEAGVENAWIEEHTLEGWYVVDAPAAVNDPVATRAIVEAMAPIASALNLFVTDVFVDDLGGPMFPSPWTMVQFGPDVDEAEALAVLGDRGFGGDVEHGFGGLPNAYRVRTSGANGFAMINAVADLALRPDTIFAEPDMVFSGRSNLIPDDPGFAQCWGLNNTGQFGGTPGIDIRAIHAWDTTIGTSAIQALVIDTGVQQDHPDINQLPGFDATGANGGGGPMNQCDNHGTPVAGCISAIINNGLGTVGIAPGTISRSARTMVSNPSSCDGSWSSFASWTVASLAWADDLGVRVTNNSNFYGFTSSAIAAAYQITRTNGMVHFASAGNFSSDQLTYPSSLPSVNAIAAIQQNGQLASFSNFGNGLSFAAPGVSIYSTDRTGGAGYGSGDYRFVSGTSFASPYTAGVAALILSVNPNLTAQQVEGIMAMTAMDLGAPGYDTTFGWGLPRADAALTAALGGPPACPGDVTGDSHVDKFDLNLVLANFGEPAAHGDANADGAVNLVDLNIVLANFGTVCK